MRWARVLSGLSVVAVVGSLAAPAAGVGTVGHGAELAVAGTSSDAASVLPVAGSVVRVRLSTAPIATGRYMTVRIRTTGSAEVAGLVVRTAKLDTRGQGKGWGDPRLLPAGQGRINLGVPKPGRNRCVQVQARDVTGQWSPPAVACAAGAWDDRALQRLGRDRWRSVRHQGAHQKTLTRTTAAARGARLARSGVRADRIAVRYRRLPAAGPVSVSVRGRTVGRFVTKGKKGYRIAVVPARAIRNKAGRVVLRATRNTKAGVLIDAVAPLHRAPKPEPARTPNTRIHQHRAIPHLCAGHIRQSLVLGVRQ